MVNLSSRTPSELRVPIFTSWLTGDFELVANWHGIRVANADSGTVMRLDLSEFVGRDRCALCFRVPTSHCIDFAGRSWDGIYNLECADEESAELATMHIRNLNGRRRLEDLLTPRPPVVRPAKSRAWNFFGRLKRN